MATKERPILFSGPMVRAILEGKKTQTRRVVRPQPEIIPGAPALQAWLEVVDDGTIPCPYGVPGDRLWVRETWGRTDYEYDGPFQNCTIYRADGESGLSDVTANRWRPSIHMPRWASRLTLEVVDVRVERVQSISNTDAEAEGVAAWAKAYCSQRPRDELQPWAYFQLLWDSINKSRGYGWDANPWVWVVEFRRVESEARP